MTKLDLVAILITVLLLAFVVELEPKRLHPYEHDRLPHNPFKRKN